MLEDPEQTTTIPLVEAGTPPVTYEALLGQEDLHPALRPHVERLAVERADIGSGLIGEVGELGRGALQAPDTAEQAAPNASELPAYNEERYDFGAGEVMRFTPYVVRNDEATGEAATPLLYVQGMNGNDKLSDIMAYLAQRDQRPVIAVRYYDRASGSPKPVTPGMRGYRPDAAIPELDVRRTDDLLAGLHTLGDVHRISIVAESAGAVRALLLADALSGGETLNPSATDVVPSVVVENLLLVDPAGQDGRSYRQTHRDAFRLARAEKRAIRLGTVAVETIADSPKIGAFAKQRRDRPEQRAVAHAQLQPVLAEVSQRMPVRILSDEADVAFRTARIAYQMQESGAADHAELIQTNKGGHGVGLNRVALDTVIANLHELERTSRMLA